MLNYSTLKKPTNNLQKENTMRTIEQIENEITATEAKVVQLKGEKMLTRIVTRANEEDATILKQYGPELINKYASSLILMDECWCSPDGRRIDRDQLLISVCADLGISVTSHRDDNVYALLYATSVSKYASYPGCFSATALILLYCTIKNNPSILEEVKKLA